MRQISSLMQDPAFYEVLFRFDQDLAAKAREAGCRCGGALHQAHYERKPRGGPPPDPSAGGPGARRLSYCCGRRGCRLRHTPPSVRFLGRRVYWGVVVVLVMALEVWITERRYRHIKAALGVSRQTLARWRQWWREEFAKTQFWHLARASFMPPVQMSRAPASLVERFCDRDDDRRGLVALLAFLGPLTTGSAGA